MARSHPWYLVLRRCPDPRLTLYGLHCAGGGPSMFRTWADHLPEGVELRAVRLPGRPGRHREEPFTDVDRAVEALLDGLGPELGGRYVLAGHSMGAMLAYRLTHELRRRGAPLPVLLAVMSWPPRGAARRVMPDPDDDTAFASDLRRIGGVPDELFADPVMLERSLPVVRADFRLCRGYAYRAVAPLDVPVIAFNGDADTVTPPGTLRDWHAETTDFRGLHLFPGGHFFLNDHAPALIDLIVEAAGHAVPR
ncbi:thioesterase II family protein [Actinomadura rupiterrae]|uniref:thioesterase II family protein n=1 Tax=Actinomadura rupiterrae TaxID=559627 RepID=UPI0020A2F4E5|nr:alpha/beta fold hydrolase [Actinomadura rupiterrae]MCP2339301.1 surfactin synthase thioesterase subunit [Actinomadura rupiterrae]